MTQYTHNYQRAQTCNNFTDSNGVVHEGNCSHTQHYLGAPHCQVCGLGESASVHFVPKGLQHDG